MQSFRHPAHHGPAGSGRHYGWQAPVLALNPAPIPAQIPATIWPAPKAAIPLAPTPHQLQPAPQAPASQAYASQAPAPVRLPHHPRASQPQANPQPRPAAQAEALPKSSQPRPRALLAALAPSRLLAQLREQRAILTDISPRTLLLRACAVVAAVLLSYALLSPSHFQLAFPADAATPGDNGLLVEPMPFEQPGMSFPGSAFYYLAPEPTQPGPNPLAPDAHSDGDFAPGSLGDNPQTLSIGPAARPMAQITSPTDRIRALTCLTAAIYYEAATEPDAGQRAVAQVILNRMAHPAFPKTVCGVVYQGSEKATGCQFTFSCDGSMARHPMAMFWNRAEAVARAALGGYVYAPVGLATHYHTFQVHPYWDSSVDFIGQIGAHRFYRMEGLAGSPELFSATYRGGEPAPGPHPRSLLASTKPDIAADPLALQRAFATKSALAQYAQPAVVVSHAGPLLPAPAYTSEVLRHGGDAAYRASNLPESRAVNPEYQNSGRWLGDPQ